MQLLRYLKSVPILKNLCSRLALIWGDGGYGGEDLKKLCKKAVWLGMAGRFKTQKEQDQIYQLKIPNYEIKTLFRRIIGYWLQKKMNITNSLLYDIIQSLTHNRIKEFEKYFQAVMGDTFSYFDVTKNPEDVW